MKLYITCFLLTLLSLNTLYSQNVASGTENTSVVLKWNDKADPGKPLCISADLSVKVIDNALMPVLSGSIQTTDRSNLELIETEYEILQGFDNFKAEYLSKTGNTPYFRTYHTLEGNNIFSCYQLSPFKKEGGQYFRLKSYAIKVNAGPAFSTVPASSQKRAAANSVLGSGQWLKYSVSNDGVYKISGADLAAAGWDINSLDPRTLKVYGHHGGMLPEVISVSRFDDIPQNAIIVVGEDDGKMSASDYILFYAQGPNKVRLNTANKRLFHETNIYSDLSYFYVTFGGQTGKRMASIGHGQNLTPDISFNWFDDMILHEKENENICNEGRIVLGEKFDQKPVQNFNHKLPNVTNNRNVRFYYNLGALSPVNSTMLFRVNNTTLNTITLGATPDPKEVCFFYSSTIFNEISPVSDLQLSFQYNQTSVSSKAWLDFYEIQYTRQLRYNESFMTFRNFDAIGHSVAEYRVSAMPGSAFIWDVSDPINPKIQNTYGDNGENVFRVNFVENLNTFILCDGNYSTPKPEGKIENQNLHNSGVVQFIIITHPDFKEASNRLADWHRTRDNMEVKVVTPQEIYNEFSSGSQDISAIRDYLRHVYYQNTNPVNRLKYVLMMGDASYDYKDKVANNSNFVPVYESDYKLQIPRGIYGYYCSDDFFGFLDSTDGYWEDEQKLEVTVSRFPVVSAEEANNMVDKVINYKDPKSLGEWRNFVSFCADDVDEAWEKEFVEQFESIYNLLDSEYSNVNVRKVYTDAFKQVNLNGSQRYPEAQQAIKKEFEQGSLLFNYIGHGGEEYLASEKVIDIPLITSMNNKYNMPAFFTATCEFSRFDDAKRKSAGEYLITQKDGGAIAMFTTTRVVGSFPNYQLTYYFWENCMYVPVSGKWPRIGDVYKKMKNRPLPGDNDRRFSIFADPALTLNYPEFTVKIDSILQAEKSDTVRALSKVTFVGHIEDISANKLTSFNGTVFPIVYDKPSQFKTLSNDVPGMENNFELYSNILYKGQSTVNNGDYSFTFVMPKDINYVFGNGRVSLYADNSSENKDASGNYRDFIIGGASANAVVDNKGPDIELFVDDYSFVSGGLTDQSPLLLARVFDENGINTSGTGIGRDIIATIDKGTPNEKRYNLNAFYTAKLNSYTSGDIKYQLEGLPEGRHTYTLKVWDVYNNSSEATIEFVVKNNEDLKLEHVLNYPNPFSTNTTFLFDHNHAGENLKVIINIYTISGKVLKTIEEDISNAPGHVAVINWNGRDEADDKPARGVYIYKLIVITEDGRRAEKTEKLVILN